RWLPQHLGNTGCACDATPFIHVALNGRDRSPLSRSRSGSRLSLLDITLHDTALRFQKWSKNRAFGGAVSTEVYLRQPPATVRGARYRLRKATVSRTRLRCRSADHSR